MAWGPQASVSSESLFVVQLVAHLSCEDLATTVFARLRERGWVVEFEILARRHRPATDLEVGSVVSVGAWTQVYISKDAAELTRVALVDALSDVAHSIDSRVALGLVSVPPFSG